MREIAKRSPFLLLALLTPLLVGLGFFLPRASSSPEEPSPCPQELPGGLDRDRLLVLDFATEDGGRLEERIFREDVEELLLANRYQLLSSRSPLAHSLPRRCMAWRLSLVLNHDGNAEQGQVDLWARGELVEHFKEEGDGEKVVQPLLRQRIAARLVAGIRPHGIASPSLHQPLSAAFRDRRRAMTLQAEGRLGEAAEVLRAAVARDGEDAALRFRLGQVLGSWAEVMRSTLTGEIEMKQSPPRELENESLGLLREAEYQLGHSLELDAGFASAHFFRGRVRTNLGQPQLAEADFGTALEIWPAYAEALRELAHLRTGRGAGTAPIGLLGEALDLIDSRKTDLRAELLFSLGASQLRSGSSTAAVDALQKALALVPAERRLLRAEVLFLLAQAQLRLGDEESACATWQRYRALAEAGSERGREGENFEVVAGCAGHV